MALIPDDHLARSPDLPHPDGPVAFRCDVLFVGDHAVAVVRGEVDMSSAPLLLREILATLALPITGVTVDLAYVTFLDSSGVSTLLTSRSRAVERGIEFRLESVPQQVRTVFATCDLLDLFGLTDRADAGIPPALAD